MILRLFTIFIIICNSSFADSNDDKIRNFVNQLKINTIEVIQTNSSDQEKFAKLATLFRKTVDLDWIAKFALARYNQQITDQQRAEYQQLFSNFLINNYIPNFKKYTQEDLNIILITKYAEDEFLVQTEIVKTTKGVIKINYMLRKAGDLFKIFDIVAEGVSLINTQRSEFNTILNNGGIEELIKLLRRKVNQ